MIRHEGPKLGPIVTNPLASMGFINRPIGRTEEGFIEKEKLGTYRKDGYGPAPRRARTKVFQVPRLMRAGKRVDPASELRRVRSLAKSR